MRSRGSAKAIGTASIRAASAEPRAVRPAYLIHGHVARVRLCGQHNEGDRDALHDARLDACEDRERVKTRTVFCAFSGMKLDRLPFLFSCFTWIDLTCAPCTCMRSRLVIHGGGLIRRELPCGRGCSLLQTLTSLCVLTRTAQPTTLAAEPAPGRRQHILYAPAQHDRSASLALLHGR